MGKFSNQERVCKSFVNDCFFAFSLLFLLFCTLSVSPICAMDLYNGKSSEIFNKNSSDIKNEKLLKEMVKKTKTLKGAVLVNIFLQCTEVVPLKAAKKELGELRAKILKEYFIKHLPHAEVLTKGITHYISQEEYEKEGEKGEEIDMLMIQCADTTHMGDISGGPNSQEVQPQERWKRKLLKRYKKLTAKHSYLCHQKESEVQYVKGNDAERNSCPRFGPYFDTQMCLVRGELPSIEIWQSRVQYNLDRLLKHQETSGEVYEIAQEIARRDPKAGGFIYDHKMLEDEIKRAYLAINHFEHATKVINSGLDFISKWHQTKDPECFSCQRLRQIFGNWKVYDVCKANWYSWHYRQFTLNHLMDLHTYVRTNLGLGKVEDSRYAPICVLLPGRILGSMTNDKCEEMHDLAVQPYLIEFGIPDVPYD